MKKAMKAVVCLMTALASSGLQLISALPVSASEMTAEELFEKYNCYYAVEDTEYGWTVQSTDGNQYHGDTWIEAAQKDGFIPADAVLKEYSMLNPYQILHIYDDPKTGERLGIIDISYTCEYEDGFFYTLKRDGTALIAGGDSYYLRNKNPETMVIPEKLGGATVTEIAEHAFDYWTDSRGRWDELREVIIPDTVEIVGCYAFVGMFNGKMDCKMNLPANLKAICRQAFAGLKNALGEVVELPETVEYMQDDAFLGTVGKFSYPVPEKEVEAGLWDGKSAPFVEVRIKMPKSLVFTDYAVPHRTTRVVQEWLKRGDYQSSFEKYYLNGECNIVCFNDALNYQIKKDETDTQRIAEDVIWEEFLRDEIGDVNANGDVDVADAVLLARVCAEDKEAVISSQGYLNADVNKDGCVDALDNAELLTLLSDYA